MSGITLAPKLLQLPGSPKGADAKFGWTRPEVLTALIFRAQLLPFSETFIEAQANSMKRFRPHFAGFRKVTGRDLSAYRVSLVNRGGWGGNLRELRYRLLGPSSGSMDEFCLLQPSLIHAHFGPDACEALPIAEALQIPLVATFHGYDATRTEESFRRSWHGRRYLKGRARLARSGSLFIAVSDFIKRKIEADGFPSERVRVHYIGVDIRRFEMPKVEQRKPVVLFVARLVEKKGCSLLLDAMKQVQVSRPEIELVVIGEGPQRKELEQKAGKLLRNFRFLGAQTPEVVKEWMHAAKVFCVPSVTASDGDAEGFGMVFAEAQACGLPVVSFANGGIPEAVADGETGLLAAERDVAGLTRNILLLIENSGMWQRFSRAARNRVERHFDLARQTVELERIYEEAMAHYAERAIAT